MPPDPRGSPSSEDYIRHLEFFKEQQQRRIEELESQRMVLLKKLEKGSRLLAIIGLWIGLVLWIPSKIMRWSERKRKKPYEL